MVADVYNTTVNVNGNTMFSSTYSPCVCNCGMGSCFGYGFGGYMPMFGFGGNFMSGLGFGTGYAAGLSLTPMMPTIFKGIGQAFSWLGTKVIAPAASFAWNNVLKPVGNAVWSGIKWVGNTVAKGAKAVGKAIGSLFHKKSKTEKAAKAE